MGGGQILDSSILQHRVLTREEERRLLVEMEAERELSARAAEEKDPATKAELLAKVTGRPRAQLVLHNLRLAVRYATKYRGRGVDFDDLVSEAVCGVLRAADLFDASRENTFATYATWWIRQYIQRAITYQGKTVRHPDHVVGALKKLWKLNEHCQRQHGRLPKRHEIARHLKCSSKWVDEFVRALSQKCVSLNYEVGQQQEDVGLLYADPRCPDPVEETAKREQADVLEKAMNRLSFRHRSVLRLRYGLDGPPLTLQQIADREDFRVSKERVRQMESKALAKLKRLLKAEPQEAGVRWNGL